MPIMSVGLAILGPCWVSLPGNAALTEATREPGAFKATVRAIEMVGTIQLGRKSAASPWDLETALCAYADHL
jgi:hypothetical protein